MKIGKIILIVLFLVAIMLFFNDASFAQCAMCKATVKDKVDEGGIFSVGINKGIIYLMSFPYLIFGVIAYFWYQSSKKNSEKQAKVEDIIRKNLKENG
jgi:hypothetical protein